GGTDAGAAPLETMLAAFLSCHNVVSNLIADEMGIELSDVIMGLDATLDTNGLSTTTPTELPFPEMKLTVNLTTSASDDEIARLRADVTKRCPVMVVMTRSGTQIHSTWNVSRP
ncbi:MAG TPA: OsmC family protein, partial [Alphaproteobacteria bacterium]|nr:OsmC family protein [Alphaproteobacteria bacterium]